jgi:predicted Fe-Mo cluster-binding NifX family protein
MKIAIPSAGMTLESEVNPRFGRSQYFIIADPETMKYEAIDNSNTFAASGVGISAGQMIASKSVDVVLTGNCGPNAFRVLSTAGIKVMTGVSGKIREAIRNYKEGKYQASSQPNVDGHFGMGKGQSSGR